MGGQTHDRDKQNKQDIDFLIQRPEFRRFLFRVIQSSRIFQPTSADGADAKLLNEGRRSLGLEILEMVEAGQPVPHLHPQGPLLTVVQALHEEISFTPAGKAKDDETNTSKYDRYSDDTDDDE